MNTDIKIDIPQGFIEWYEKIIRERYPMTKQKNINASIAPARHAARLMAIDAFHHLRMEFVDKIMAEPDPVPYQRKQVKEIAKNAYLTFAGLPSEFDKWFDQTYPENQ